MNKMTLTDFSLRFPWLIVIVLLVITVLFAVQFPKVKFDNDPENMLADNEPIRVFHRAVKARYDLYDFVIVGIVNKTHEDGIFNVGTLTRIDDLTKQLISLHRDDKGRPTVITSSRELTRPDLKPKTMWRGILDAAFSHNPEALFDDRGDSAIIAHEIISPSVVDNIRQARLGTLAVEYLMEQPPINREQAMRIRHDAMNNPLYKGTLVSEDGKAICLYIPIKAKTYSYNVANLVENLTRDWPAADQVYITGQPVAQDTFGVEMLVQMATSAPLAGLAVFLLLYLFFRRISLIIAPMLLAVICVISTMGLLIGAGYDVHIMSSMIAIFLMPIAVADSVHILSEFFDTYHCFHDKRKTVRHVIDHLFMPMLYTSLTTIAGFASLVLTPIPPVQIFGAHVAFGVALAWILTMTFIPAYIMLFIGEKSLSAYMRKRMEKDRAVGGSRPRSALDPFLEWLGRFSFLRWRMILIAACVAVLFSIVGILMIEVNDNPIKWFTKHHRIRIADRVLNDHFGGTYTAYLTLRVADLTFVSCVEKAAAIRDEAEKRFRKDMPRALDEFLAELDKHEQRYSSVFSSDMKKCFVSLVNAAAEIDRRQLGSWNNLADAVLYLEPENLTLDALRTAVEKADKVEDADRKLLLDRLADTETQAGIDLQDRALAICEEYTRMSFEQMVYDVESRLTAPLLKRPAVLEYLADLQRALARHPVVGKTSSAVDALKKAHYELKYVAPPSDAGEEERREYTERNQAHYAVPDSPGGVAEVYVQLQQSKKPKSLFHLVTRDFEEANVWFQLMSGDNRDMLSVVKAVDEFLAQNPPPVEIKHAWAGLTYLNVRWQNKMVWGMFSSLAGSFVVVMVMMMLLFRSFWFGLMSMIPLSITIMFIYGLIGWVGKPYDMPVAVLSALTLGLSVDFAIHFLQRARELTAELGSWKKAAEQMFKEPAMAISRNAIVIAIGFTPLLFAPLVPYKTVGFFLAAIMIVSWLATLFILAALASGARRWIFAETVSVHDSDPEP